MNVNNMMTTKKLTLEGKKYLNRLHRDFGYAEVGNLSEAFETMDLWIDYLNRMGSSKQTTK